MEKQWKWFLFKRMNSITVFRFGSQTPGNSSWFMIWIQKNRFVLWIYRFKFTFEWRSR